MDSPQLKTTLCKNCSSSIVAHKYCASCGQKASTHVLTFREFIADLFDGLFNLDSRMWHTLIPLVIKPGKLTNEFLIGKREFYLPPFRLYLVLSLIYFILPWNVNDDRGESIERELPVTVQESNEQADFTTKGPQKSWCNFDTPVNKHILFINLISVCEKVASNPKVFVDELSENMPLIMAIGIPLLALFMKMFYAFSHRKYIEHVIFIFHLYALYFLISILAQVLNYLGSLSSGLDKQMGFVTTILWLYTPVYMLIAVKKVYKQGWFMTCLKHVLITIGYFLCIVFSMSIGAIISAFSI